MSIYRYERALLRKSCTWLNMCACWNIRLRTGTDVCVLSGIVYDVFAVESRHKFKDMEIMHKILFATIPSLLAPND